jgi:hypothetical protein
MNRILPSVALVAGLLFLPQQSAVAAETSWHMNATIIEACSCPMFCQCYFNPAPAAHHAGHGGAAEHFCKANNAYRINQGHHGQVKLDGAKFWASLDLGGNFASGKADWIVLTFDKATTREQRRGIEAIVKSLMPMQWGAFTTAEGEIAWTASKDEARALLDGGKTAEVHLKRFQGMSNEPVVIQNLKYWGAQRNDGFILMPNVVEAYRVGPKAFEYKGTNGFMITFDLSSGGAAVAAGAGN